MMRTRSLVVLALALSLGVVGCGDDDGGGTGGTGGTGGRSGSGGGGGSRPTCDDPATTDCACVTTPTNAATFDAVFDEVFCTQTCTDSFCHGPTGAGEMKLFRREDAYTALVGVLADGEECRDSGLMRVVAGDAAASLLVQKLRPNPVCGGAMPQFAEMSDGYIPAAQIAQIEAWINAGALRQPPPQMDSGVDDSGANDSGN